MGTESDFRQYNMFIDGPCGNLESRLDTAPVEKTTTAVLCHPHPQYGGSMYDGVLDTVAGVLLKKGINCLRFNFRGVGASDGAYDEGVGEVEDLYAVANWVAAEYPRDDLWLCGYSFGSSIVWRSLAQLRPVQTILIAPPVGMMNFPEQPLTTAVIGIAGDADNFVNVEAYQQLLGDSATVLAGADHFFSGMHATLETSLEALLSK